MTCDPARPFCLQVYINRSSATITGNHTGANLQCIGNESSALTLNSNDAETRVGQFAAAGCSRSAGALSQF